MFKISLSVLLLLVTQGCSQDSVKRATYETLQNMREQECSKTPSVDCEARERLEVYEDKRVQVE